MSSKKATYDLAIIVVTYNQEKVVIEALESIKYQIVNNEYKGTVQIIIADDGSSDETQYYIKRWFEENRQLFASQHLLMSAKNRGTSANFAEAVRYVDAKHFYSIAGDDIFSPEKVFEIIEHYDGNAIARDVPYIFQDYKVKRKIRSYFSSVCCYFQKKSEVYFYSQVKCPFVNGSIVGIDLMTNSVLEFSKKTRLLDDQSRYLKMFEENDDIEILNEYVPIIVYRLSDSQVTNISNWAHKYIVDDKRILTEYILDTKKSLCIRVAALYEFIKIRKPLLFKKCPLLDTAAYKYIVNILTKRRAAYRIIRELLAENRLNDIDSFLKKVHMDSMRMMSQYNSTK